MKNFRRFCFALVLAAMFAIPALGGQLDTPPCMDPGQTDTPPGQIETPPCGGPSNTQDGTNNVMAQTSGYVETIQLETPVIETVIFLIQTVF